jgi:malate dehydrogenase (oxaloacetate-decarboxylating)
LTNALRVVGKRLEDIRIVVSGVGAAGHAIIALLLGQGATDIIGCGRHGAVHRGQTYADPDRQWIADHTNAEGLTGSLRDVLGGADVFIGVSGPNLLTGDDIATMNADAIVFALANPDPEVDPLAAGEHAAVVATGRSDYPNQINNVLAFPGVFRGALDIRARTITQEMQIAAARALAAVIPGDELAADYVIPSVFDREVAPAVARAVAEAAVAAGVARAHLETAL